MIYEFIMLTFVAEFEYLTRRVFNVCKNLADVLKSTMMYAFLIIVYESTIARSSKNNALIRALTLGKILVFWSHPSFRPVRVIARL